MTKIEAMLRSSLERWKDLLSIEEQEPEPGFLGPVPYLLALRWLIFGGASIRFYLHRAEYSEGGHWVLLLVGLAGIVTLGATYAILRPTLRRSKSIRKLLVGLDIVIISSLYLLTGNTQSDFFLFYYLPILSAGDYLGPRGIGAAFGGVTVGFGCALLLLWYISPDAGSLTDILLRTFAPREIFFVSVVVTSSLLVRLERIQREKVLQREYELKTLLERREEELVALRAIDNAIVAQAQDPGLSSILELILDSALEIIMAPIGAIMWFNRWTGELELATERGMPKECRLGRQRPGEGIVGLAAARRESVLVHDVRDPKWRGIYTCVIPETRSELTVPIVDDTGLLAVFNVEDTAVSAFCRSDQALLETLAVQAAIAIHSVQTYEKLESQIRSLHALSTIATRIQDVTYTMDKALRLLLTGVTAGAGLGYSRAMLFLAEDAQSRLEGKLAVGAQTRSEAESTWQRLDAQWVELQGTEYDELDKLLQEAEDFSDAVTSDALPDWPLSKAIQEVSMRIAPEAGAPSRCMVEERTIIVSASQEDPFRDVIEQVSRPGDRGLAFASVPLIGRQGTLGALVVDNRFLINEREISEDTLDCLEAFAGVIAMSIENIRMQTQIAREKKLESSREFTARIAHMVGGRLAVIKGTVTQLRHELADQDVPGLTREGPIGSRLHQLTEGVRKAEMKLTDLRQFAAPLELRLEQLNIIATLRSAVAEIRHIVQCPVPIQAPSRPILVRADAQKMSEAFSELILNAREALEQAAIEEPEIRIAVGVQESLKRRQSFARIEFADNGPGVPKERKERIFDPFYSTKGIGSGLGLAIVKEIVEEHGGDVRENGVPGEGACFVMLMPIVESETSNQQGRQDEEDTRGR